MSIYYSYYIIYKDRTFPTESKENGELKCVANFLVENNIYIYIYIYTLA